MNATPNIPSPQIQEFLDLVSQRKSNPTVDELFELFDLFDQTKPAPSPDDCGFILGLACHLGFLEVSMKILEKYPSLINFQTDLEKYTKYNESNGRGENRGVSLGLSPPFIISLTSNDPKNDELFDFLINQPYIDLQFSSSNRKNWDALWMGSYFNIIYKDDNLNETYENFRQSRKNKIKALLDKGVDPFDEIKVGDFWLKEAINQERVDDVSLVIHEGFDWNKISQSQIDQIGKILTMTIDMNFENHIKSSKKDKPNLGFLPYNNPIKQIAIFNA